jgi:hypothetical protein
LRATAAVILGGSQINVLYSLAYWAMMQALGKGRIGAYFATNY